MGRAQRTRPSSARTTTIAAPPLDYRLSEPPAADMGTPKKTTKKIQSQLRPRTTRSSKARLLSDPMENTALLTEQLRSLGLYAAPHRRRRQLSLPRPQRPALRLPVAPSPAQARRVRLDRQAQGQVRAVCRGRARAGRASEVYAREWSHSPLLHGFPFRAFAVYSASGYVDRRSLRVGGVCAPSVRVATVASSHIRSERGSVTVLTGPYQPASTYGGHMELSAFAHLTRRNVKVIQPGLVYVIEWAAGGGPPSPTVPTAPSTSTSASTGAAAPTSALTVANLGSAHSSTSSLSSLSSLAPSVSASASAGASASGLRHHGHGVEVIDVDAEGQGGGYRWEPAEPVEEGTIYVARSPSRLSCFLLHAWSHYIFPISIRIERPPYLSSLSRAPTTIISSIPSTSPFVHPTAILSPTCLLRPLRFPSSCTYIYISSSFCPRCSFLPPSSPLRSSILSSHRSLVTHLRAAHTSLLTSHTVLYLSLSSALRSLPTIFLPYFAFLPINPPSPRPSLHTHISFQSPPYSVSGFGRLANLPSHLRYHDWEHFSSIRNLKGPHTGLPAVRETPPYPSPTSEHAPNPKQSKADAKERKRMEREAQRERKNKQREHAAENSSAAAPNAAAEGEGEGAGAGEKKRTVLPKVRLKLSSASPTKPVSPSLPPSASKLAAAAAAGGVRLRSLRRAEEGSAGPARSESVAKRTRSAYAYSGRAPSREDDDAHDNDGDDAEDDAEEEGEGEGEDAEVDVDVDGDGDVEMESGDDEDLEDAEGAAEERTSRSSGTSGTSLSLSLSPPALSSSSSLSSLSSVSPSPPPQPVPVAKPLTRRERKKLGLPKTRATAAAASAGAVAKGGGGGGGAGKIVIPGGRFEGTGEWRRNGTGRLDVRGFRELKI
ncbi:hypothetical protein MVEN_01662000 [Mycena venus]|uniref:Uncharacterized protein n=1 Tax=Mycena venus TaxID=2733690 RepID=A0A8H6XR62_9AGAR|nr:hypothetical protein MVEN_01662000 [Mycena venus]